MNLKPKDGKSNWDGNLEEIANRAGMLLARMDFQQADSPEWFKMELTLRDHTGESLTEGALRKALERGEDFLKIGDRFVLLPRKQTEPLWMRFVRLNLRKTEVSSSQTILWIYSGLTLRGNRYSGKPGPILGWRKPRNRTRNCCWKK